VRRVHGLPVAVDGRQHDVALVLVQPPVARPVGEPPLVALHHGQPVQQPQPGARGRRQDDVVHRTLGVLPQQRERPVVVGAGEGRDLVQVGAEVAAEHVADDVVAEGLAPGEQREAGGEAPQVPADVPEVGLVEVVDVEDDPALAVHVRAEVLRVQVTLDPHARRPLVTPGVLQGGHVGVEQAGGAAVEGERVGGHLAELRPEGVGVGGHQVGEGVHQDVDDLLPPGPVAGRGEVGSVGHGPTVGGG
jgi:hypothetical protein